MALVTPIDPAQLDPEIAALGDGFLKTLGFIPASVLTMAYHPGIATAFVGLHRAALAADTGVEQPLKRMVAHISSKAAGCQYCQAHTIGSAASVGVSDEKLADLWSYETSPHFDERERAALDFAVAASTVPNAVTPEVGDRLKAHFSNEQIVALMAVIGLFGFLNRWNDSMSTELEADGLATGQARLAPLGWTPGRHAADGAR